MDRKQRYAFQFRFYYGFNLEWHPSRRISVRCEHLALPSQQSKTKSLRMENAQKYFPPKKQFQASSNSSISKKYSSVWWKPKFFQKAFQHQLKMFSIQNRKYQCSEYFYTVEICAHLLNVTSSRVNMISVSRVNMYLAAIFHHLHFWQRLQINNLWHSWRVSLWRW